MTLEWAGISFEQGSWQYSIRIAAISNASSLVPLLSGTAGYMVAENSHRVELHGEIGNVDSLMLQPIQNSEEFLKPFKSMAQCQVYNDVLESPSVVHLFGHHKNNRLMLRNMICLRTLQHVQRNCQSSWICSRCCRKELHRCIHITRHTTLHQQDTLTISVSRQENRRQA